MSRDSASIRSRAPHSRRHASGVSLQALSQKMTNSSSRWRDRTRAAGNYVGLLPLALFRGRRNRDDFAQHHSRQAGALFAILAVLAFLFVLIVLGLSYLLVHHRAFYLDSHIERHLLSGLRKLFLAWLVFWAFGLCLALLGSARPMPLIRRLAKYPWIWRSGALALLATYSIGALLVPVWLHARALAPAAQTQGSVYFLYEDNDVFPRWFFLLVFYPMTRTASDLWGDGSVVVQRFDRPAVLNAVAHAEAMYLGTHGTPKGLMLDEGWLTPDDLNDADINPNLRFVYISGCDSGRQREGWVAALAPAEVVTYDRLSAVLEHAWWLWFRGPDKLRAIYKESPE